MKPNFEEIRSYRDNEVRGAVDSLMRNPDVLKEAKKHTPVWLIDATVYDVDSHPRGQFKHVNSIYKFQKVIGTYVRKIINHTTDGVSYSGLENLAKDENYTYIINHRTIMPDFLFLDYILLKNGYKVARCGHGDNLNVNKWFSAFMKCLGCFVVKRKPIPGELRNRSHHIKEERSLGNSICLPETIGRSKDGNDFIDPAIIRMMYLA